MAFYAYQKLQKDDSTNQNEIRILSIKPGSGNETVHSHLTVSNLEEVANNSTYESLSYCWGDEPANMCIFLRNDDSEEAIFNVRPNLYNALCAFRYEDRARLLWIDAICINQDDAPEKSAQIPLMRRIYEGSIGTLIWLGDTTPDSQPAMALARALKYAFIDCGGNVPRVRTYDNAELTKHGLPWLLSTQWAKLLTMLEQPWFGRAWIVQEVTVSERAVVYWGKESLEWQDLIRGIDFAQQAELPFALHPAIRRFVSIADEVAIYKHGNCRLLSVLLRHRPCDATVSLDKVYAFLGLTEKGIGNLVSVNIDYQQTPAVFFADVARKIAEHDQSLDILSLPATPIRSSMSELPSWAPDWSLSTGKSLRQTLGGEIGSLANTEGAGSKKGAPFRAARTSSYSPRLGPKNNILVIQGHKFDVIVSTQPRYESMHITKALSITEISQGVSSFLQSRNVFRLWEDSVGLTHENSILPRYPTGEDAMDAFYQTLMMGNIGPTEDKAQLREQYLIFSRSQKPSPLLKSFKLQNLHTAVSAVRTLASSVVKGDTLTNFGTRTDVAFRSLVRTEKGYMGMCSGDVKAGDQIWLGMGSKVPVVLRLAGGDGHWTVVGDAYVHGIMYGEGFQEAQCHDVFLQ